jgi:NAD(P)-dependent dehydrogenase (short-subunit alcohol dehydrogenase family)
MAWTVADIPSQAGRLAVVTGPGGLGYETALALAGAGAAVIVAGRNPKTGEASVAKIRAAVPGGDVRFELCDLASLGSVQAFASKLLAEARPINILVNNAGVMMPPARKTTADGFELQFGTNYLGHYALTARLLPLLSAGHARVVNVSSIAASAPASIHFDDLQFERGYRPDPSYGQSKLAMLMFGLELQRQSQAHGWGITSIPAHPGVAATDLIDNGPGATSLMATAVRLVPFLRQPAARGALPQLMAATDPTATPGGYYGPDGIAGFRGNPVRVKPPARANDLSAARRLWDVSEQLTGVHFG